MSVNEYKTATGALTKKKKKLFFFYTSLYVYLKICILLSIFSSVLQFNFDISNDSQKNVIWNTDLFMIEISKIFEKR